MNQKKLILNLKKEYFNDIKNGNKKKEYRLKKDFWSKRLSKNYDLIEIRSGYPKSDDKSKILKFKWDGFVEEVILHKEFGNCPVEVYAISLNKPMEEVL